MYGINVGKDTIQDHAMGYGSSRDVEKKQFLFLGLAGSGFAEGGWKKEKNSSPNGGDSMMMYDG